LAPAAKLHEFYALNAPQPLSRPQSEAAGAARCRGERAA
jgi:hypothetical protein